MSDFDTHQLQESMLAPTLEGTAAATQRARRRGTVLRPATVVSVSPSREAVEIIDDTNPGGTPVGATNISGLYLNVGDRVMVLYYPPHGAVVLGMRQGGYTPWMFANNTDCDKVGFFGCGWDNDSTAVALDQDGPSRISWRRNNNVAELQGRATRLSGVGAIIAWVPGGFRPRNDKIFPCTAGGPGFGSFAVLRTGKVVALAGNIDVGTSGYMILDGTHYSVD